jgi:hypothetical protein
VADNARGRQDGKSKGGRPLRSLTIALWAIGLISVGVAAVWVLLHFYGAGSEVDKQRLDVIRTAGTIVVGTGGVAALYLAARRQQSAERTLEHTRHVEAAKESDANDRRVSEQYAKAAEMLGNEKAPVRMAALYALERLANADPAHQQTVVDLLCAYLRMRSVEAHGASLEIVENGPDGISRGQESEVRRAAQEILARNLRYDYDDVDHHLESDRVEVIVQVLGVLPGKAWRRFLAHLSNASLEKRIRRSLQIDHRLPPRWPDMRVRLNGASLENIDLRRVSVASFEARRAIFLGRADFESMTARSPLILAGSRFSGAVTFDNCDFTPGISTSQCVFESTVSFRGARFNKILPFGQAEFRGSIDLYEAKLRTDKSKPSPESIFLPVGWGMHRLVSDEGARSFGGNVFGILPLAKDAGEHSKAGESANSEPAPRTR